MPKRKPILQGKRKVIRRNSKLWRQIRAMKSPEIQGMMDDGFLGFSLYKCSL